MFRAKPIACVEVEDRFGSLTERRLAGRTGELAMPRAARICRGILELFDTCTEIEDPIAPMQ